MEKEIHIHSVEILDIGALNIDLMRERIDRLVNSLIGVMVKNNILPVSADPDADEMRFESDTCTWTIEILRDKYNVRCLRKSADNPPVYAYSTLNGAEEIRMREVQFVYENRRVLSEGLQQKFPLLTRVLEPLAQAASMSFS